MAIPTEAQWEYAARAAWIGAPWYTGEEKETLEGAANLNDLTAVRGGAIYGPADEWLDDRYFVHAPVGTFYPNPFGLHDIHGNVYEWCREDWWEYHLAPHAPGDGEAVDVDVQVLAKMVRGGSYSSNSKNARLGRRDRGNPDTPSPYLGLRPSWKIRD